MHDYKSRAKNANLKTEIIESADPTILIVRLVKCQ